MIPAARLPDREIWLDVSRLLEMTLLGSLTGIDRVELAYVRHLSVLVPDRLRFVAQNRVGRHVMLDAPRFLEFALDLKEAWGDGPLTAMRRRSLGLLSRNLVARSVPPTPHGGVGPTYLLVSHRHLEAPNKIGALLRRCSAIFVPMVHDLIPMEFPEYVREGRDEVHRRRVSTIARFADGIIVNSAATMRSLAPYIDRDIPSVVAHLGTARRSPAPPAPIAEPYFVCIATIEPRKNHITLLHTWRQMAQELGDATPRLVLVGRAGWENEQVMDLLRRSPAIRRHVDHRPGAGDAEVASLLAGARALLLPSFAEGFGMPVAEALAAGTPVICSDIPALREVGTNVPDYIDPLDSRGWQDVVLDYASALSQRRAAQLQRMEAWHAPTWEDHVARVLGFLEEVGESAAARTRDVPTPVDIGSLQAA